MIMKDKAKEKETRSSVRIMKKLDHTIPYQTQTQTHSSPIPHVAWIVLTIAQSSPNTSAFSSTRL